MSGPVVQLVNMPVTELGNLLKVPLALQTSIVILGMVVLWYGLDLLTFVESSACNKSEPCKKIFEPIDVLFYVVLFFMATFTYAYYFYEGVRAHGLISFKSYAKPIGLLFLFFALKVVFADLTTVLTVDRLYGSQETGTVKTVTQRYFGRFLGTFGGQWIVRDAILTGNESTASSVSLTASGVNTVTLGALIGVVVALITRR